VVVMHGRTNAQPDDVVHLEITAEKTHVFDGASEQRLR
jgi:multiple sugar transport system ATP-binding protein